MAEPQHETRRGYELGKRLEQMDQTRAAVLLAARAQLEEQGYRRMTMASLAAESGVTRQTIHNLFGTKRAVLEALFDSLALDGGMEQMRQAMSRPDPAQVLEAFVGVFCGFWESHRVLFRRIHGIGAIDLEFGEVLAARNLRRHGAATRIVQRLGCTGDCGDRIAALTALTSFEFYDAAALPDVTPEQVRAIILRAARAVLDLSANT